MNLKSIRKLGICVSLALTAYGVFHEFMPEILALGWHVRHGRTAHLQGSDGRRYRVDVPALWWAHEDGWNLSLVKTYGRGHSLTRRLDGAMATVEFDGGPVYFTAEKLRKIRSEADNKVVVYATEVSNLTTAGQTVYCVELRQADGASVEMASTIVNMTCVPLSEKRFFTASYLGTRALIPEFYEVLKGVRRLDESTQGRKEGASLR